MGQANKYADINKNPEENGIVSGSVPKPKFFSDKNNRKYVVIGVVILLVLALAGLVVFIIISNSAAKENVKTAKKAADNGFVNVSENDIKKIADMKVDAKTDPEAANAKAQALSKLSDNKAALAEYNKIIVVSKSPRYAYNRALVAARSGDIKLAIEAMELAIQLQKEDVTVSAGVRATEVQKMQNKLAGLKSEAGIK